MCENNVYGEYTRSELVTAGGVQERAEVMEIPSRTVDGNDVWAVREAASAALDSVRAGEGLRSSRRSRIASSGTRGATRVRTGPRASSTAGAIATRSRSRGRGSAPTTAWRTPSSIASRQTSAAELEAVEQRALEAPFPSRASRDGVQGNACLMHVCGRLSDLPANPGRFSGHSELSNSVCSSTARAGSPHQEVAVAELGPGGSVDRHLHAFEEAFYVLRGQLTLEMGGTPEELAADDYVSSIAASRTPSATPAARTPVVQVSAPQPGADLQDTVFVGG